MESSSVISIIVAVVFVLWGAWSIYKGVRANNRAKATHDWPATTGRVVNVEVTSRISSRQSNGHTVRSVRYEPVVTYEYQVAGSVYTGVKIQQNPKTYASKSKADEVANQYPVETTVMVYYDPQKIEDAVLVQGGGGAIGTIFGGVVLILLGLVIVYFLTL